MGSKLDGRRERARCLCSSTIQAFPVTRAVSAENMFTPGRARDVQNCGAGAVWKRTGVRAEIFRKVFPVSVSDVLTARLGSQSIAQTSIFPCPETSLGEFESSRGT